MPPLPPTPPMSHKIVVGTIAGIVGMCGFWWLASDFEFVKFTPRSPEEIEQWKKEGRGLTMREGPERTLDYKPEVKERILKNARELMEKQKEKEEAAAAKKKD